MLPLPPLCLLVDPIPSITLALPIQDGVDAAIALALSSSGPQLTMKATFATKRSISMATFSQRTVRVQGADLDARGDLEPVLFLEQSNATYEMTAHFPKSEATTLRIEGVNDDGSPWLCIDMGEVERNIRGVLVLCDDGSTRCPTGSTCCPNQYGGYGCCPDVDANCCADKIHCCPDGQSCHFDGTCGALSLSGRTPWLTHTAPHQGLVSNITL